MTIPAGRNLQLDVRGIMGFGRILTGDSRTSGHAPDWKIQKDKQRLLSAGKANQKFKTSLLSHGFELCDTAQL